MINNNNLEQKDSLLPPPEILVKYQELGKGDDIIKLVKKEQEHRHLLQKKYQTNYRMGQLFGFILCALIIVNIFSLMKAGMKIESYIMLGIFSLLTIIICFITRTKKANTKRTSTNNNIKRTQRRKSYR